MYATDDPDPRTTRELRHRDSEIIQRSRDDPEAFAELYWGYRTRIYWYLRARLPNDEDAADVTQQVFMSALERLGQYRERKGSFATWLFTIARNAATDFHRRHRSTTPWEDVPFALHPTDDHDPAIDVLRHEAIARVWKLVATLPSDKRELLELRYAGGLSIAEIATVIGKSQHATRKQLTRLIQLLEDHYDDPYYEP
jgi:RNA polymerase sigma-70 factor (ECF subfamily)